MAKYLNILLVFLFFENNIFAQSTHSTFTLNGTINLDSGIIKMLGVGDDIYYAPNSSYKEAKIEEGKFTFSDSIRYPSAFRFRLDINNEPRYMSGIFIVDPGEQTIHCNIDSIWEIPSLTNKSMKELNELLLGSINEKNTKIEKNKTTLLEYTKKHPNSYIALWKLIDKLSSGYEHILDSTYNQLSDTIKNTYIGKILAEKLSISRVTGIGNIFPKLPLLNIKDTEVSAPSTNKHIFTLIDFWFSYCTPCISQFKEFKEIYARYKVKGFEIIGISTDTKNDESKWKNAIIKYKLPWMQYWDVNGKESGKLSIISFPTNFLVTQEGEIIAKNIKPLDLNVFLDNNLNKK